MKIETLIEASEKFYLLKSFISRLIEMECCAVCSVLIAVIVIVIVYALIKICVRVLDYEMTPPTSPATLSYNPKMFTPKKQETTKKQRYFLSPKRMDCECELKFSSPSQP